MLGSKLVQVSFKKKSLGYRVKRRFRIYLWF